MVERLRLRGCKVKQVLLAKKSCLADVNKCLERTKFQISLYKCASLNELPGHLNE